jgi:hypothetical protein
MRFLVPLLLTPLAVGQNFTAHPIDNTASTTSQNIPFAGGSTSWDEARSHFLFLAPFLPSGGGVVTGIEIVPNNSNTTPYEQFELWLDHTTNATLSTTFANNLTSPTKVLSKTPGTITWSGGNWTTLQFDTPFVYDGTRNLVLEVRKKLDRPNNTTIPSTSHRIIIWPRRADLPVPIWAYGIYGSGAVNATTATTTYNTQILIRLRWLPAIRTLTINSSRDTTGNASRSYFHLGATVTPTTQGQAGDFYGVHLDASLRPTGLVIPGIIGKYWLPNVFFLNGGVLDSAGRGSFNVTIPSDTNLIGVRFYLQGATANASAIALTNVVDGVVAAY